MYVDGVVRKIDCRHKISIPASMMEEAGLHDGDLCVITGDANGIHIIKKRYICRVCGKQHDDDTYICMDCAGKIKNLIEEKVNIDRQEKELYDNAFRKRLTCRECTQLSCKDCTSVLKFSFK